jgi:hypothetical protein
MKQRILLSLTIALGAMVCGVLAQEGAPGAAKGKGAPKMGRPPLFFKETWKDTPGGEHAVNQTSLSNPNLELKLYPESQDIQVTGASTDENNPVHLWTGLCPSACGATFRDKNNMVDLTGLGRIRWTHKMSGFHQVRPMLKLADGTFIVGDRAEGSTADWLTTEIALGELRWRRIDPKRMLTVGDWLPSVDLSKVDEIGYVDLIPGSGHGQGGWSDVATVEVYGKAVKR